MSERWPGSVAIGNSVSRPRPGGYAADASIEARLVAAKLAIEGVLGDANLLALMAARGCSAARLAEGLALQVQQRASLGAPFIV
ncbi:MAG TPA: hypothetical protein VKE41_24045 [Roseiflexaceae bacterium]|nr:hypothetical protein [Roseiflexaceae bacterium]